MRHLITLSVCAVSAFALSACDKKTGTDVDRAFQGVNVVDESNLNDVMLSVADPNEAVSYFQRATGEQPERLELARGLAKSLVREMTRARSGRIVAIGSVAALRANAGNAAYAATKGLRIA